MTSEEARSHPQQTAAQRITVAVLRELYGRGGFDHWWDQIEAEDKAELVAALVKRVEQTK